MPFPMKVQPIDSPFTESLRESIPASDAGKPVFRSRLRKLFDRRASEKPSNGNEKAATAAVQITKEAVRMTELEPSSVCLAKMVQNFIEESNEKEYSSTSSAAVKCGRNRCTCFNGHNIISSSSSSSSDDSDDDPWNNESSVSNHCDSAEILKSLVASSSAVERKLSSETARIVEMNKGCKRKDELRKIVADGLSELGYDVGVCRSRWDKSTSIPAGEYGYIDILVSDDRFLIDVDFRSEFELARSTSTYRSILQSLPYTLVGKPDRIKQIVSIISEAAKQSLRKKGMHIPPWRKSEYVRSKWLSPYTRTTSFGSNVNANDAVVMVGTEKWEPPAVNGKKREEKEGKVVVVTGLASLLNEKVKV